MRTLTYTPAAGRYRNPVTLELLSIFRDPEGDQWAVVRIVRSAADPFMLNLTRLRRNSEVTITDDSPAVVPAIRRRTQADLDALSMDKLYALGRKLEELADTVLGQFEQRPSDLPRHFPGAAMRPSDDLLAVLSEGSE